MISRLKESRIVLLLILLCGSVSAAAADPPAAIPDSPQPTNAIQASTNRGPFLVRPDQIPISPINSLNLQYVHTRTNPFVRVRGIVLDQGLGEYVILQDDTGTLRADTRQTIPLAGGESVIAFGRVYSDGNQTFLANAVVRPVAWDSVAEQKITPAPGKPDQLPVLTQVHQIRDLPPAQAAWNYPVHVRGVITSVRQDFKALYVQDATAGIFVTLPHLAIETNWMVGSEVELEGVSGPGGYAPVIEAAAVTMLGHAELPEARLVTLYQMASGQFDSQWIEVRGVVRAAQVGFGRRTTTLEISDLNGLVEVNIPDGSSLTNLVDSLVQVRGVCGSRANLSRQLMSAYVWSPSTNFVVVKEPGAADPFTLTALPIASLSDFTQRRAIQHRIKIAGVVTFSEPGRPLYVQDATGGVPVYLAKAGEFTPGDAVEVAGYLSLGDYGYVFRNALCRVTGRANLPPAKAIAPEAVLSPSYNGLRVELVARLLGASRRANEDVLTFQAGTTVFEALRPGDAATRETDVPAIGSLVRLQGVYAILGDESRQPRAIRIYLDPNENLQIVERPPWWNTRHALTLFGAVLLVALAAALWAILLRRQVREQILVIRERLDKEAALQESYREIFDGANDLIFTQDLQGRITSLNPAAQHALGYSGEELGTLTFDQILAPASRHLAQKVLAMKAGDTGIKAFECEFAAKDGRSLLVETSLRPMVKDGKPYSIQAIGRDISDRKRAEAALAEASSLLQTLLDNSPDCIYFKDQQSRFVRYSRAFEKLFNVQERDSLHGKSDADFFTPEHARVTFEDEQQIIRSGKPIIGKLEREAHVDGRVTWCLSTKMPWRDKSGGIIGTFGISKDVTAIKNAEEELAYERELFRTLLETLPDAIYFKDRESRFVRVSRSKAEKTLDLARSLYLHRHPDEAQGDLPAFFSDVDLFGSYLIGKTDFDTFDDQFARVAYEEEQEILRTGRPVIGKLEQVTLPDQSSAWLLVTKMPWRDPNGQIIGTFGVSRDVTALKEAERKLEAAHHRLVETSRLAGMAEVATDVLHNVGNVLNSVNVSCSLAMDRVRGFKLASLSKISTLLSENQGRLPEFFTQDPRGAQIPEFISAMTEHLTIEQSALLKELDQLGRHIDHIKQIVAMQQSYAKVAGVLESVSLTQLVDDAVHINAAALTRHEVHLERELEEIPRITTEKHKVLQILVNLIRNAKYALDDSKRPDKRLVIKVSNTGQEGVKVQVIDNGVGIAPENLTKIFSHGFTTRRNGHGFGLHSSALAVRELGGSLLAQSEGPGTGATFTLQLPLQPPAKT